MGERLSVTQHCSERYAERIMSRDNKTDIAVYVAQNKEKIEEDVNKLYEYGELIYSGTLKDKNSVNVYLNGTWVLLTDKSKAKAITMYKIDFGLGEDFNKSFVEQMMKKIDVVREAYCDALRQNEERKNEYRNIIGTLTEQANEYRRLAKSLDKQIENYTDAIKHMDDEVFAIEDTYRRSVMDLVCKKEF